MNEPCHDTALPDAGDAKIAGCPPILALPGQSVGSWAHHIGFFERELPPIRMEFSSDGQFLMVNPPTSQYMLLVVYKSTPSAILHNIHSFIPILLVLSCSHDNIYWLVVWNIFYFPIDWE